MRLDEWGARELMARKIKERRIAVARARRVTVAPPPIVTPCPVETFETPSGIRAYRKTMPNLTYVGVVFKERASGVDVSLPWVSILEKAA
jgi:hypothetical protein